MLTDLAKFDLARDMTLHPDIRGPALLVKWRQVPIGWVRPFNRIPRMPKFASAESKAELRNHYKPLIGKWHSPLRGARFFDSKEEAAQYIIARTLEAPGEKTLLLQAAIRNDSAEVQRLLAEIRASVVIDWT